MASPAKSFLLKIYIYMYKKPEARQPDTSTFFLPGPIFIVPASSARYFVPGLSRNHGTMAGTAQPEF